MIGISGIAASGKDLFCRLLLKEIKGHRIALADQLKEEINPYIISKFGIDVLNCSTESKNKDIHNSKANGYVSNLICSFQPLITLGVSCLTRNLTES